jgi:hypothetical protein
LALGSSATWLATMYPCWDRLLSSLLYDISRFLERPTWRSPKRRSAASSQRRPISDYSIGVSSEPRDR